MWTRSILWSKVATFKCARQSLNMLRWNWPPYLTICLKSLLICLHFCSLISSLWMFSYSSFASKSISSHKHGAVAIKFSLQVKEASDNKSLQVFVKKSAHSIAFDFQTRIETITSSWEDTNPFLLEHQSLSNEPLTTSSVCLWSRIWMD